MLCDRCHQHEATVTIAQPVSSESEHYCEDCASIVMQTPRAAHRFGTLFATDHILRVTFREGDVFRLQGFDVVHPTVYGDADRWTGWVVEAVHGSHPDFARLYRPASGFDFHESDITEIFDESSSTRLFEATQVA
jgi:hypothetical protein